MMYPPSDPAPHPSQSENPEYSPAERRWLLEVAHRAIAAAFGGHALELDPPSDHLAEARGAFTTLHLRGKLRGCIGYVLATEPLYKTVAETARAAAFDDPRFQPVEEEQAGELKVEISVLSPLRPIAADEIVIGKHGLVIMQGSQRGLLLPQVPIEWGWDRETFLEQTCLKAGLAADAWRHGSQLSAFTAEVFGEK